MPSLFSEWMSISDASRSKITGALPVVADDRRHTWRRVSATAPHTLANVAESIERTVRYSVESDGTAPNKLGCARSRSMSEHASPPPASINIACTSTLPRSCTRNGDCAMRADSDDPSPSRSAREPSACNPT